MITLDELVRYVGEAEFAVLHPDGMLDQIPGCARIFGAEGEEIRVMARSKGETPEETRNRADKLAAILNWCEGQCHDI